MSWTFRYDSPSEIHRLLESHSLAMSKKFGQNFLLSHDVRTQIAEHILGDGDEDRAQNIWEIGPGIGNITSILLEKGVMSLPSRLIGVSFRFSRRRLSQMSQASISLKGTFSRHGISNGRSRRRSMLLQATSPITWARSSWHACSNSGSV